MQFEHDADARCRLFYVYASHTHTHTNRILSSSSVLFTPDGGVSTTRQRRPNERTHDAGAANDSRADCGGARFANFSTLMMMLVRFRPPANVCAACECACVRYVLVQRKP